MFHPVQPSAVPESVHRNARRYLRRTFLFGAGLALLWVALQLAPRVDVTDEPDLYTDDAGTVATSIANARTNHGPRLFTWGNLAALALLAAGGVFAVYLQRRPQRADGANSPLRPLGELTIGQQQQLRLVRCGDDVLLLGVTTGQITLLRAYPVDDFATFAELADGAGIRLEPSDEDVRVYEAAPSRTDEESNGRATLHDTGKLDHRAPALDLTPGVRDMRAGGPRLLEPGSRFADVLRQVAARYGNGRRNGSTC